MGGLIILAATIIPTVLWAKLNNRLCAAGAGGHGLDGSDRISSTTTSSSSRSAGAKRIAGSSSGTSWLADHDRRRPGLLPVALSDFQPARRVDHAAFFKYVLVVPAAAWLAWIYVPFVTFVLTGVSNAVNLTDGLDGLAAGLTAVAALTFALFAYVIGRVDTSTYLQIYYLRGAGSSLSSARRSSAPRWDFSGSTRTRRRCSWATRVAWRSAVP